MPTLEHVGFEKLFVRLAVRNAYVRILVSCSIRPIHALPYVVNYEAMGI